MSESRRMETEAGGRRRENGGDWPVAQRGGRRRQQDSSRANRWYETASAIVLRVAPVAPGLPGAAARTDCRCPDSGACAGSLSTVCAPRELEATPVARDVQRSDAAHRRSKEDSGVT